MGFNVTFNVVSSNGKDKNPFTIYTDNTSFINSIITVNDNKEITQKDMNKLLEVAQKAGDLNKIEYVDMQELQKEFGYNDYYDIKLSDDGKFYEITIKDAGRFTPDPKAATIIEDFSLSKGVLYDNNKELLKSLYTPKKKYVDHNGTTSEMYLGYENAVIPANKVIKLPVGEVTFSSNRKGWCGRIIDKYSSFGRETGN